MSPSRRPGAPVASLVAAAVLSAAAVLGASASASAATTAVEVRDFEYAPAATEVAVGDTVRWTWTGASAHSVTAAGVFDSHPQCTRLTEGQCGTTGETFSWTASEAGTIDYACRLHPDRMRGTITVVAAAAPEPEPAPSPSPAPSPAPASPSPTPASPSPTPASPSPSPPPPPAASPAPTSSPSPSPSPRPTRRSAPSLGFGEATEVPASPLPTEDTDGPAVAPPVVSDASSEPLEPFPAAPSPSPSPDPLEGDVVAVGPPDGPGRDAVRLAGAAAVAMSVLVFGRVVLFGRSWE